MSVRTLGRIAAVLFLAPVCWGGWQLTHLWSYERVGPFVVRRNALTGKFQVRGDDGAWIDSLGHDAYAPAISGADLKAVRLTQGAWGPAGVLCGRAENTSRTQAVQGRLGILIVIYQFDGKRYKDRTLRAAVDWPAGSAAPFVLDTQLPPPAANQRWTVNLVPLQDSDGG